MLIKMRSAYFTQNSAPKIFWLYFLHKINYNFNKQFVENFSWS
nr:MAG TPA: hypothetical protein [Caudoviricetes sp.]